MSLIENNLTSPCALCKGEKLYSIFNRQSVHNSIETHTAIHVFFLIKEMHYQQENGSTGARLETC